MIRELLPAGFFLTTTIILSWFFSLMLVVVYNSLVSRFIKSRDLQISPFWSIPLSTIPIIYVLLMLYLAYENN